MFNWLKIEKIIEKINLKNCLNRNNSPSVSFKNKKVNFGTEYHKHGLGFEEVERLTTLVVKEQVPKIIEAESKKVFEERVKDFLKVIEPNVRELSSKEINQLTEPDTQIMLREAAQTSGRRTEEDVRAVLAHLVTRRIKSNSSIPGESIKDIVFKEAVQTVGKMTSDQLKIVTMCYLLKYTKHNGIRTWEQFDQMLEKSLKPFIEFKNTDTEFQHIEYVGAGSIAPLGSSSFCEVFSKEYGFIFNKGISENEITSLDLKGELKDAIFYKEGDYFRFKTENKKTLDDILELFSGSFNNEKTTGDIRGIWNKSRMSKQEVEKEIKEKSDVGRKIFDIWEKSPLPKLTLTSVGIAIAATNYEQAVGDSLDIDIWIK